jgi:hypothetical protein
MAEWGMIHLPGDSRTSYTGEKLPVPADDATTGPGKTDSGSQRSGFGGLLAAIGLLLGFGLLKSRKGARV